MSCFHKWLAWLELTYMMFLKRGLDFLFGTRHAVMSATVLSWSRINVRGLVAMQCREMALWLEVTRGNNGQRQTFVVLLC